MNLKNLIPTFIFIFAILLLTSNFASAQDSPCENCDEFEMTWSADSTQQKKIMKLVKKAKKMKAKLDFKKVNKKISLYSLPSDKFKQGSTQHIYFVEGGSSYISPTDVDMEEVCDSDCEECFKTIARGDSKETVSIKGAKDVKIEEDDFD